MEFDQRTLLARTSNAAAADNPLAPGKRTLTEQLPVQRREAGAPSADAAASRTSAPAPSVARPLPLQMLFGFRPAPAEDPAEVHAAAAHGTATPTTKLPYADQIQRAFGQHDISGIQAHAGRAAASSARQMGARAYATGNHVVLGDGADLHTVAHEAAHIVQQRSGGVPGGIGDGDSAHELAADAVADRVVRGESAADLLGPGGGGGGAPVVQRKLINGKKGADIDENSPIITAAMAVARLTPQGRNFVRDRARNSNGQRYILEKTIQQAIQRFGQLPAAPAGGAAPAPVGGGAPGPAPMVGGVPIAPAPVGGPGPAPGAPGPAPMVGGVPIAPAPVGGPGPAPGAPGPAPMVGGVPIAPAPVGGPGPAPGAPGPAPMVGGPPALFDWAPNQATADRRGARQAQNATTLFFDPARIPVAMQAPHNAFAQSIQNSLLHTNTTPPPAPGPVNFTGVSTREIVMADIQAVNNAAGPAPVRSNAMLGNMALRRGGNGGGSYHGNSGPHSIDYSYNPGPGGNHNRNVNPGGTYDPNAATGLHGKMTRYMTAEHPGYAALGPRQQQQQLAPDLQNYLANGAAFPMALATQQQAKAITGAAAILQTEVERSAENPGAKPYATDLAAQLHLAQSPTYGPSINIFNWSNPHATFQIQNASTNPASQTAGRDVTMHARAQESAQGVAPPAPGAVPFLTSEGFHRDLLFALGGAPMSPGAPYPDTPNTPPAAAVPPAAAPGPGPAAGPPAAVVPGPPAAVVPGPPAAVVPGPPAAGPGPGPAAGPPAGAIPPPAMG